MRAGDQEHDWLAAVFVADMKVTKAAEEAESDAAVGVEAVAANPVIDLDLSPRRRGFEASVESLEGSAAVKSSVWTLLVVDGAEGIELELEVGE